MKIDEIAQRVQALIQAVEHAKQQYILAEGRLQEARELHMLMLKTQTATAANTPEAMQMEQPERG